MTIDTAPDKGTRINIALRVGHAVAEHENPEAPHVSQGSETVLVVDDDPDVREIMCGVLSDLGYHIKEAGCSGIIDPI